MLQQLEHIGIAVKDADKSVTLFNTLFNREPYKTEAVESEGVKTIFYQTGESKIELLESTKPDSAIAKFIEKKGEGIHHLAFLVTNIEAEIERLKQAGFEFVSDQPKQGADNKRIVFLHPKSTNGVLIELCEEGV